VAAMICGLKNCTTGFEQDSAVSTIFPQNTITFTATPFQALCDIEIAQLTKTSHVPPADAAPEIRWDANPALTCWVKNRFAAPRLLRGGLDSFSHSRMMGSKRVFARIWLARIS
jgi:hypothetical protein